MPKYLLLGAGFSRNWGGWLAAEAFEYLLGCPEIMPIPRLRELLWRHSQGGGFEDALAELQRDYRQHEAANLNHMRDLERAISRMFEDMNRGYFENPQFEFQQNIAFLVGKFLTRFDAIFTLNQDLLLEHAYAGGNVALLSNQRWNGAQLPGMRPRPDVVNPAANGWARTIWVSGPREEFIVQPRNQPIFKLHGSSNWNSDHGGPMLVIGGNKVQDIGFWPILQWNFEQFQASLTQPNSLLMVIGYGFRDAHINDTIAGAVMNQRLRMFVIAPEGAGLARNADRANANAIRGRVDMQVAFQQGLIGASRRPLREIFGGDGIEFAKVMRFFDA